MRVGLVTMLACSLVLCGCSGSFVLKNATADAASTGTLVTPTNTVAFGSVAVGQTSNASVTLSNQGTAPVEISQLNITGQSFSVSGQSSLPMTVAANGSVTLTIQFSPAASGPVTGQLTITSNASTGTSTAVSLSGTGVPVLSGLSCTSRSMTGAGPDSCTVTLNAAAASGGLHCESGQQQ